MKLINGKEISKSIKDEIKAEVEALKAVGKRLPKLVVVLVGDNQASQVYVRNKERGCQYTGMLSEIIRRDNNCTQEELLKIIDDLNHDDHVDGILVQLPLPKQIDEQAIIEAIDPTKDVDGFHPRNIAKLFLNEEGLVPCTPAGMMAMLDAIGYDLDGKEVCVVGRSNIVGKPVSLLALARNATVTIAHSHTKDLPKVTSRADVLIAAIGQPKFFTKEYIKEGAVVLDVGMDRDENNKLCGDVDFEDVKDKCHAITPVPGGVGPMTIALLLKNTMKAYKMRG
ncbi:bifunctional methylenetetrahydrofolate dehydrogenase/methenyltetrahydrofolate cyclohydrolase FolD [Intestinibaculum porci]|uniref:bifunctional methylenetetrahydrofolate dehydrogenase/methenyltetrahydrofolate cyclohydrolase FolD n=1 Tax=Intestinibaculum porci TaxID=2487118 RepID=UPI002408F964|nr:bifunctional methylenetetrahydrofolate dehydrogenase/methenyltetrahydrofolate cyclohydrolase FolD [Intestinibaculum porci]MDD6349201.1 bifunctional methylenetetrahydrofolate dehydrogenase/methenyltetrahydrofolate cyclohydrolase FolD [Intestinibaculum porci]MDD6423093.1 bifunctional methylenetetrahydrofolate dehydrogenase/methenyltetrahydrofolate cyclohydrolase FolD [Intestinibaculum porci]